MSVIAEITVYQHYRNTASRYLVVQPRTVDANDAFFDDVLFDENDKKATLKQFSRIYIEDYAKVRNRKKTWKRKQTSLNALNTFMGHRRLEDIATQIRLRNRFSVIGLGTRFLRRTPIGQVQILPAG